MELSENAKVIEMEYDKLMNLLPSAKQTQIHKFRFDIDKKLSLLSDVFVRYFVCTVLNFNNAELSFSKNIFGKPYLTKCSDFHYNISHTRNAIAIGISEKPIGVDIEKIRSTDLKIAERFFCKSEVDYIFSKEDEQEKLFYEIWTRKEAYIKFLGKGLSMLLTAFDVISDNISKSLVTFEINEYIISICNAIGFSNKNIVKLNEEETTEVLADFASHLI